jgi:hypothetical protein
MTTVNATEAKLETHEQVCAFRYEQINARLKRIESTLVTAAGVMIMSMAGVIFSAMWLTK